MSEENNNGNSLTQSQLELLAKAPKPLEMIDTYKEVESADIWKAIQNTPQAIELRKLRLEIERIKDERKLIIVKNEIVDYLKIISEDNKELKKKLERLQKGIFVSEEVGDVSSAITLESQVISLERMAEHNSSAFNGSISFEARIAWQNATQTSPEAVERAKLKSEISKLLEEHERTYKAKNREAKIAECLKEITNETDTLKKKLEDLRKSLTDSLKPNLQKQDSLKL